MRVHGGACHDHDMPDAVTLRHLVQQFPHPGRVEDILLRPERLAPIERVQRVQAWAGRGLEGDRYAMKRPAKALGSARQVTLIQAEHLAVMGALLREAPIDAARLRRNVVISGLNLMAVKALFKDQPLFLHLGPEVVLEITGPCEPCSRMEAELGPGGYNAMRGHGGMNARVRRGGHFGVGDAVSVGVELVEGDGEVKAQAPLF